MILHTAFLPIALRVCFFRKVISVGARRNRSSIARILLRTPPITSGTSPTCGSRGISHTEPHAPNLASHAPNTIRPICVCRQAPAHIGHGSNVTTSVQSARFQVPSEAAASAIALTSAWASGSACVSRRFRPRPITRPSAASTTAPTGTSPSAAASRASATAGSISSSHRIRHSVAAAIRPLRTTGPHVRPACPTCAPNRSGTNVSP